ncbi:MAG: EF-P 5-aminopentanol modification-associated protein YfmH [Acholeplasmatales bacterium]
MKHLTYPKYNENVYFKELDNGLKVYLIPKMEYNKTFVTFTTNYGSFDTSFIPRGKDRRVNQPAGIAHFLEHKLFAMPDGTDAFEKLSSYGVNANAFTSFDRTSYLFSGTSNIKEALVYLLDFVQTPYFTPKSVKKEQGIIIEEYQMYEDNPDGKIFYGLLENMYQKHPLNTTVLGTIPSIKKITAKKLYEAYDTFYHPSNMILTVIGSFNKDEILEVITKNQNSKAYVKEPPIERFLKKEPNKLAIKERTLYMSVNMPYIGIGVKLTPSDDFASLYKQHLALDLVLNIYLSTSGDVYNNLLKKGIINKTFGFDVSYQKGAFGILMSCMTNKDEEFINEITKSLVGLKRRNINIEAFERQKKVMQGNFIKSLNSLENYNVTFTAHVLEGINMFDIPNIIASITLEDVKAVIKEIKTSNVTTLKIYPKKDKN